MTNNELKQALLDATPVVFLSTDGTEIEYKCVSAIVYRKKGEQIDVSVELLDKNKNSVVYCDPEKVRRKEGAKSD